MPLAPESSLNYVRVYRILLADVFAIISIFGSYMIPLVSHNLSSLFLNMFIEPAPTTSAGRLFHWSVVRPEKQNFPVFLKNLSLKMLNLCPLILYTRSLSRNLIMSWETHRNVHEIACISPLYLRYFIVGSSNFSNLSLYDRSFIPRTSLDDLLWTFSFWIFLWGIQKYTIHLCATNIFPVYLRRTKWHFTALNVNRRQKDEGFRGRPRLNGVGGVAWRNLYS